MHAVTYTGAGSAPTAEQAREQAKKIVAQSIIQAIKGKYLQEGFPYYFTNQEELKVTLQIYSLLHTLRVDFTRPLSRNNNITTKAYVRDVNIVQYIKDTKEKFDKLGENIGREELTDMIIHLEQASYLLKSVDFTDIVAMEEFLHAGIKKMQIYRTHPSIILDFNISDKQIYLNGRGIEANRIYLQALTKHTISIQKENYYDYNQSFTLSDTSVKTISPVFIAKKKFALRIEVDPMYLHGLKRFFAKYNVTVAKDAEHLLRVHFFEDAYNKVGKLRKVSMRVDSMLEKDYEELYRTFIIVKEYCPLKGCDDSLMKSEAIKTIVLRMLHFLSQEPAMMADSNESNQTMPAMMMNEDQNASANTKEVNTTKPIKKPKKAMLKLENPTYEEMDEKEEHREKKMKEAAQKDNEKQQQESVSQKIKSQTQETIKNKKTPIPSNLK